MHVAFSRTVKGAGIIAGVPYWCTRPPLPSPEIYLTFLAGYVVGYFPGAQADVDIALTSCMTTPDLIDLSALWSVPPPTPSTLSPGATNRSSPLLSFFSFRFFHFRAGMGPHTPTPWAPSTVPSTWSTLACGSSPVVRTPSSIPVYTSASLFALLRSFVLFSSFPSHCRLSFSFV
jgi:hypothetical protein